MFADLIDLQVVTVNPESEPTTETPFRLFNGPPRIISLQPKEIKQKRKVVYTLSRQDEELLKKRVQSVAVTAKDIKDQAHWWVQPEKWNRRIIHISNNQKRKEKRRRNRKRIIKRL